MSRPVAVASADWHICRSAWASPRVVGDADFALTAIVDLCLSLKVPLLAAGDLFNSVTPHPDDVAFVGYQMERLGAAKHRVYFIQGNHEKVVDLQNGGQASTPWLTAASSWPVHIDSEVVAVGPLNIMGMDFRTAGKLPAALTAMAEYADHEAVDFLLCHQAWSECSASASNCQGKLVDIPGCMQIISGDYHKCKTVTFERKDGSLGTMYSPGAIHRLKIDEPDAHFVYIICDDRTVTPFRIPSRYCGRFDVEDEAGLDDLIVNRLAFFEEDAAKHAKSRSLPAALAKPLLRVRYRDNIPNAAQRLQDAADGKYHLFPLDVDVDAPIDPGKNLPAVSVAAAPNLLSALATYDLLSVATRFKDDEAALRSDLERLLDPSVPAASAVRALVSERVGF
jgi:hypothetical protein